MTHLASVIRSNGANGAKPLPAAEPELPLPIAPEWRLDGGGPAAFRCRACGSYWLAERDCCGAPAARARVPYYVSAASEEPAARPDFSIIILTKEKLELTRRAVESLLRAAEGHRVELVFVDCASGDGSHEYFRELAARVPVTVIVTHPEEPFVYARNCNRGAQAAGARFLLFANNDIEARDRDLFPRLHAALSDPRVGVAGVRTDYDCSNDVQQRASLEAPYVWSVRPVMGFLWGVRAEVFAELGGLDEQFTGYGCDEIDFEYRAVLRNYRIAVADSLVHHDVHATFGSALAGRLTANLARFEAKHGCDLKGPKGRWYEPFLRHSYPRISVAISCRNQGSLLPRALDSVLDSYLPPGTAAQAVVVDDASTDETAEVARRYARQHPAQVAAVFRSFSKGPSAGKNDAIRRSVGDYVALLDADDEFLPYKLARAVEEMDQVRADFLYHDFAAVLPTGEHRRTAVGTWSLARWRQGRFLPTCAWVFRSGLVQFSEQYYTGEDPEFLRRRWAQLRTVYVPETLARYYVSGSGLSSRAMCRVVTGQLKGLAAAKVADCSDVRAAVLAASDAAAGGR